MNKNVQKILIAGVALMVFASIGTYTNNTIANAHYIHSSRVTALNNHYSNQSRNNDKLNFKMNKKTHKFSRRINRKNYHHFNKKNNNKRRNRWLNKKRRINKQNQHQIQRLAKKSRRKSHRNFKRNKKNNNILKSHFRRSNNRHLLKRSGYINLIKYGSSAPDIINLYAPNDHRAVIPKNLNIKKIFWLQGRMMQKNPIVYQYSIAKHGWVRLG